MIYLSTLRPGVGRAERRGDGAWKIEMVAGGLDVRCLAVDQGTGTVLAGTHRDGVHRSEDGGRTFTGSGLPGLCVTAVGISAAEPGLVFAGVKPAGVYRSDDGGRGWRRQIGFERVKRFFWFSPAERPFTAYVQSIVVSERHPKIVIAGIEAGAVVRSIDGGETWQGHRAGAMRDCHSLATAAGRFFEAGYGGGAMSEDGAVWRRPAGLDRRYGWAVAAVADGETWFLSSSHGVEAHSDHADAAIWRCRGGGPWERLAGGLPQPMNSMPYSLITGPEPGRLDVGFADGTVWESRDGGDTWAPLPFRLPRVERALARLDGRGRSEIS